MDKHIASAAFVLSEYLIYFRKSIKMILSFFLPLVYYLL